MNLLIDLQIKHDYFQQLKEGYFDIIPDMNSIQILKRSAIFFRRTSNGFQLYANEKSKWLAEMDAITLSLRFLFSCKDPYFLNYTDLPLGSPRKHLVYVTDLDDSLNEKINDNHVLPIHSAFSVVIENAPETVSLEQPNGIIQDSLKMEKSGNITIPCPYKGDKLYIKQEDKTIATIYPETNEALNALGTIHLHIKAEEILNATTTREYTLQFGSRSTFWRYYLVNSQDKFEKYFIENDEVTFEKEDDILLPNGQKSITLTANQPIKLVERQKDNFNLIYLKKSPINGRIIKQKMQLPYPQRTEVHPRIEEGNTKVYSDMFVHL